MPRIAAVALIAALAVVPVTAKAERDRTFSNAYCRDTVFCPNAVPSESFSGYITSIISKSNSCVGTYFGISSPDGFFEQGYPDSNGCLTTKDMKAILRPKCCIVPQEKSQNTCRIICSLNEFRN